MNNFYETAQIRNQAESVKLLGGRPGADLPDGDPKAERALYFPKRRLASCYAIVMPWALGAPGPAVEQEAQ